MSGFDASFTDAAPVLGYATPDADGVPEWVAEAEKLIEARAEPNKIRHLFYRTEDAVKYYARSQARRFSIANTTDECIGCGEPHCTTACNARWVAQARPRTLEFRLSGDWIRAGFTTSHTICRRCFESTQRSTRVVQKVRAVLAVTPLMIWVGWLLFSRMMRALRGWRGNIDHWVPRVFLLYFGLILIATGALKLINRAVPRRLRALMPKRRVILVGVDNFFDRSQPQSVLSLEVGDVKR